MAELKHADIHAVLLAAGASRRFGADNKLLIEIDGTPLVRRVAERLVSSRVAGVMVVTGFEAERIRDALAGLDIHFVENPDFAEGLAASIKCGIAALPEDSDAAMIVLGDMPGTTQALLDKLIGIFEEGPGEKIVFPERKGGAQGNPVIWPARYFSELLKLSGDKGAKQLISQYREAVRPVPVGDEVALGDIDTPGDLEGWREGAGGSVKT